MKKNILINILYVFAYLSLIALTISTAYVMFVIDNDVSYLHWDDPIGIIFIISIVFVFLLSASLFEKKSNIIKYILLGLIGLYLIVLIFIRAETISIYGHRHTVIIKEDGSIEAGLDDWDVIDFYDVNIYQLLKMKLNKEI